MKGPEDSNCKMPDAENQIRKNVDISAGASSEPAEGVCSMLASDLKRALREFFDHVERIVDRQGEGGSDIAILARSEEHTSELQSLMRISYAVFCLKKQT